MCISTPSSHSDRVCRHSECCNHRRSPSSSDYRKPQVSWGFVLDAIFVTTTRLATCGVEVVLFPSLSRWCSYALMLLLKRSSRLRADKWLTIINMHVWHKVQPGWYPYVCSYGLFVLFIEVVVPSHRWCRCERTLANLWNFTKEACCLTFGWCALLNLSCCSG